MEININNRVNIAQICTIKIFKKCVYRTLTYEPERRIFFFWKKPAGFYTFFSEKYYSAEQVSNGEYDKNVYAENNEVFYKPHVDIKMSNGSEYSKYFESVDKLEEFLKSPLLKDIQFIY